MALDKHTARYFLYEYHLSEPIGSYELSRVIDTGDASWEVYSAVEELDDEMDRNLLKEKIKRKRFGML